MNDPRTLLIIASLLLAFAVYALLRYGIGPLRAWLRDQERAYDTVLRKQLLLDVDPRTAMAAQAGLVTLGLLFGYAIAGSVISGVLVAIFCYFLPYIIVKHLERKRRETLDLQLVDGLVTLASGVRAGLNLVQAIELLVQNHKGPIQQEFGQLLREYQMGMDLNQAMRNSAARIGSPLYRLTFTAIEMHRVRGGDTGESLDRIADSIREIRRLEGKLDALTAQGRTQAWMMAVMPLVFLGILYMIMPDSVSLLFTRTIGKVILVGVVITIVIAFAWIKRIMSVDI